MAWAPRTWMVGEIVTAQAMNEEIKDQVNQRALRGAVQATDITITSSTTLVATDLSWSIGAGESYAYWAYLAYSATTNSDFRWAISVPAGAAADRNILGFDPAVTAAGVGTGGDVLLRRPSPGTSVVTGGKDAASPPADHRMALDMGVITNSSTAGSVEFRVAQGTSHADQTIFRSLSTVLYQRIA